MKLSRREAISSAARLSAGIGLSTLTGCSRVVPLAADRQPSEARFDSKTLALRRLLFEPTENVREEYEQMGREAFVIAKLENEAEEALALKLRLRRSDALYLDPVTAMEIPRERLLQGLQSATILRAAYGANPLRERLAYIWGQHFNVYARKADGAFYLGAQEESVIRANLLGRFPDMVLGIAKSGGMLGYLDNDQNRKGHPNENFARELMELHTLGVDGGYSQRDVQELARVLTGWTIERRFLRHRGGFRFDEEIHDFGEKIVLGETIPPGGLEEGEIAIERLALHPATARHLARRLCEYFLGRRSPAVEATAAQEYLASSGEILNLVRPILTSPELESSPPVLRRPFEFLIAALRATGAETEAGPPLLEHLRKMGQPLYEWPMPDGYPMAERAWSSGLASRWRFAHALAHGEIADTRLPSGGDFSQNVAKSAAQIAARIAGPEFQWS